MRVHDKFYIGDYLSEEVDATRGGENRIFQKNGYLAKPYDATDLKEGIEWVLNSPDYDKLCKNAREKVVKSFDSKEVAKKYIEPESV